MYGDPLPFVGNPGQRRMASLVGRRGCVLFLLLSMLPGCRSARETSSPRAQAGTTDARADGADELADLSLPPDTMVRLAALSPSPLPAPPPDSSNRWADAPTAAEFGHRLFFDTSFSGKLLDGDNDGGPHALGKKGETGKVSCAGCHLPQSIFSDSRTIRQQTSLGAGWGLRRAPSLLDVSQSKLLMWDGRRDAAYNQIFGPFESEVEMNSSRLFAAEQVFARHRAQYEAIFGPLPPLGNASRFTPLRAQATGCDRLDGYLKCTTKRRGVPGDRAEFDAMSPADRDATTRVLVNVGKAIGAYERLLTCGPGRFDRWMHGEKNALNASEQRGAALFVGKARCVECHSGPFLSDEKFHNLGLKPATVATVFLDTGDRGAAAGLAEAVQDPLNVKGKYSDGDDGRIPVVGPAMEGAFRTPRLRCSSARLSFMHTAQLRTLAEVIAFLNQGGDRFGFEGQKEIAPLGLSPGEQSDLVAFLVALDGPGPPPRLLVPP